MSEKVEQEVMYCSLSVVHSLFLDVFLVLLLDAALVLDPVFLRHCLMMWSHNL